MTESEIRVIRHASATLQSLNRCRKEGLLCDVTIVVGEETYLAHRYVLAVSSEYFRNLFSEDKKEEIVKIEDTQPEIVKQCIEYIYTGATDINRDNVEALWETSAKLQLPDIAEQCAEYLLSSMDGKHCIFARSLATKYEHERLKCAADAYGLANLEEIIKYKDFLELDKTDLSFFLDSAYTKNLHSMVIYNAIIKWINHDFKARSSKFSFLLRYIRLNQFSNKFFLQTIRNEPIFSIFDESRELLEEELFCRLSKTELSPTIVFFDSATACSKAYNIETKRKCKMRPLDSHLYENCSVICLEEFIYVLKGEYMCRLNSTCRISKWTKAANLRHRRVGKIECGVLNHYLYVAGGKVVNLDAKTPVVSCCSEYYHASKNTWIVMRDMVTARYSHVVIGCGDFLYSIGGRGKDGSIMDTMEKFEPNMGMWKSENNPMNRPRADATAVSHCGRIYVLGGEIHPGKITNSVEYYVPLVGTWTIIARMVFPRSCFNAAIFNDKLFAVGGSEEEKEVGLISVETMNLDNNTWTLHDNIKGIGKLEAAIVKAL